MTRRRAFLGLGSNLGDRIATLAAAVAALPDVAAVSGVYETEPVGGPQQGAFLNLVVQLDTTLSARELLEWCQRLERAAQRVRVERWGPRTLDVDVVWIDGETVDEADLEVPHPRFRDRNFVMVPLVELAPDLADDGWEERAVGAITRIGALPDLVEPTE